MKTLIKDVINSLGYNITPKNALNGENFAPDLSEAERKIYETVKPYTMTDLNSIISLIHSVKYIVENGIEGDIVECGVWRGGCMMAVALSLNAEGGQVSRDLYLYDTFSGMVEPTASDLQFDGKPAKQVWRENSDGLWCDASLEEVQANLRKTQYPFERMHFIKGRIEDTVPHTMPEKISLLRLDTDWYDSTKHELEHLYPLLSPNGILIIDDYGHWSGARKAVDEFLSQQKFKPFLQRIDYTRRLLIKPQ